MSCDQAILGIVGLAPKETYLTRTIILDALQFLFRRFLAFLRFFTRERKILWYDGLNSSKKESKVEKVNQKTTFGPKYV